jgi:hypothetical protein
VPTVVDDATLLAVLSRQAGPALAAGGPGEIVTTGAWYYRLHRALHDQSSAGTLSRMAAKLPPTARKTLRLVLDELPSEIVIPGPRLLVPVMGALQLNKRVNYLTAEALAAAIVSRAGIRVTTESPLLRDACAELSIRLELLPPFA